VKVRRWEDVGCQKTQKQMTEHGWQTSEAESWNEKNSEVEINLLDFFKIDVILRTINKGPFLIGGPVSF
jgi:hypothetical protein